MTRILEAVVFNPGITSVELARTLDAPKSSVYGFIQGLLATGWLSRDKHGFYLGPALYGLTLASGQMRPGTVADADLLALHEVTGVTVFLGVQTGESLIYVSEAGADSLTGFRAHSNIRRDLLETAGGKVLLAFSPAAERDAYLRRHGGDKSGLVGQFLAEYDRIRTTRLARNFQHGGARFALATVVEGPDKNIVAEVTLVGPSDEMLPRERQLGDLLLTHVGAWGWAGKGRRHSR